MESNALARGRPHLLLALIAVPIGAYTACQVALLCLFSPALGTDRFTEASNLLGMWALVIAISPVLAVPTSLLALPLCFVLDQLRQTHWVSYAAVGAVTGLALILLWTGHVRPDNWKIIVAFALTGMGGALAFWAVRRPDRHGGALTAPTAISP